MSTPRTIRSHLFSKKSQMGSAQSSTGSGGPTVAIESMLPQVFILASTTYTPILSLHNVINCGQRCAACQQVAKSSYFECAPSAQAGLVNGGSVQFFQLASQNCVTNEQNALQSCTTS